MTLSEARARNNSRHRAGLDFRTGYALAQRSIAEGPLQEASPDDPFAFDQFMADTVAAVRKPPDGVHTLMDLAAPLLSALLRDLEQAAGADLSDYSRLHRVRILGKCLRYAMEVFASCFPRPLRDKFYPAGHQMQDVLGRGTVQQATAQRVR